MGVDELPLGWTELTDEDRNSLDRIFNEANPNMKDLVRFRSENMAMPRSYLKLKDDLYNFPVKEDDIWIVTFPKAGTTWMQETVSMLVNDVNEEAGKMPLFLRSPFLEFGCLLDGMPGQPLKYPDGASDAIKARMKESHEAAGIIDFARNLKDRRVLKSHMPFAFLPPKLEDKCKVVYVARSPKDSIVSYYYHNINIPMHGFIGSFNDFVEQFMKNNQLYGSYWSHLESGWALRNHPNVKFIWYEEFKKDTRKVISELSEFVGHPLSEEKIDQLVEHVSFDSMKKNPAANPGVVMQLPPEKDFMRKGKVGDWKLHFSGEELEKIDGWIEENLQRTGIVLPQA